MPILTATLGGGSSSPVLSFLESSSPSSRSHLSIFCPTSPSGFPKITQTLPVISRPFCLYSTKVSVSVSGSPQAETESNEQGQGASNGPVQDFLPSSSSNETLRQARRSADWKAAKAYYERGAIYEGRIEGYNGGGLLVRFYSLMGFLPFPQLGPSHSCKEPNKTIREVAEDLVGAVIPLK
ncbi:hypothetical protein CRG98_046908, partial [Punica granatum]